MARLESVYAGGGTLGAVDAAAAQLATGLSELGADAGFVAAVSADGRTVEVARVTPFSGTPVRLAFPADAPYPLAAAIRHGFEDPREFSDHDRAAIHELFAACEAVLAQTFERPAR